MASAAIGVGTATAGTTSKTASRIEVQYVKSPRGPRTNEISAALRKGDLVSARAVYERYDQHWNGIEVYINYRMPLYQALELDLQNKLAAGLALPQPNVQPTCSRCPRRSARSTTKQSQWRSEALHEPLFDDLATLRVIRSDLRIVTAPLNAADFVKAFDEFKVFQANYPDVRSLVKERSDTLDKEITDTLAAANAVFRNPTTTVDALKPIIAVLTGRYNYAVNLWNAAAQCRSHEADLYGSRQGECDELERRSCQARGESQGLERGNYPAAAQAAAEANTAFTAVQPALAAKGSDASLRTTLATFTSLAGAAGSATTVASANKAATEAAHIATQVVVGQFWADANSGTSRASRRARRVRRHASSPPSNRVIVAALAGHASRNTSSGTRRAAYRNARATTRTSSSGPMMGRNSGIRSIGERTHSPASGSRSWPAAEPAGRVAVAGSW